MGLLTTGLNQLPKGLIGTLSPLYNAANTYIGIGDGTAVYAAAQTDLQGTNKYREPVDSAPSVSGAALTAIATVDGGFANFAWQEYILDNGNPGNGPLNRLVSSLGTKASPAVWQLTLTNTFSIG